MLNFIYNDGGREAAGYKGKTGDCVIRAIAIAADLDYSQVRSDLMERTKAYRAAHNNKTSRRMTTNSVFRGVYDVIYKPYLLDKLGWHWVSCMSVGSTQRVHVREDELPGGPLILRLSKHLSVWKNGALHDTYDCSRDGTRTVYGFYCRALTLNDPKVQSL